MYRLYLFWLIAASIFSYVSGEEEQVSTSETEDKEDDQPQYDIPSPENVFFYETFSSPLKDLDWVVSDHNEGKMKVGKGTEASGIKSEQGLILLDEAKRYAISRKFSTDFDPADQDMVIQYEVRFHKKHECGGAYMKLVKSDPKFDSKEFKDGVEYTIMFGPDKCGSSTNKVHFIFRHQHKITGEFEEKHLQEPPQIKNDRLSHLYTLIMRTDNTYEIFIDQESVKKGKLLEDFKPSVNPPKEIDDPEDKKPDDWVDEAKIDDPKATKPDDWDEDAPKQIIDPKATMPSGWKKDEPLKIPNPKAEQPEDWDEEEDGDWEAPLIDNPACSVGCGEWKPSLIDNPDYKGKWSPPKIDNPDYKGEWKPKQIKNPKYFEDPEPHKLHPMTAVGFEIWTIQDQIEFDNVFIDNSLTAAIEFGKATWAKKYAVQKAAQDKLEAESDYIMNAINAMMDPVYQYIDYVSDNPIKGILLTVLGLLVLGVLIWLMCKCCSEEDDTSGYDEYVRQKEEEERQKEKEREREEKKEKEAHEEKKCCSKEESSSDEGSDNKDNEPLEQEEGVDKVQEKKELEAEKEKRKKMKEEGKKQRKQGSSKKKKPSKKAD